MRDAGLDVHTDAAGNIVGTRQGTGSTLKPLLIGSHAGAAAQVRQRGSSRAGSAKRDDMLRLRARLQVAF